MRILIANYEYPPLGGGAGVCAKYHAEGLAELGHEVHVLTAWFPGEEKLSTSGRLNIHRVASRRKYKHKSNPLEMFSWAVHARKYFQQSLSSLTFDVCFAHFAIPGGLLSRPLKKKYGIPYIVVSHGQDIPWFFPRQLLVYHAIFWSPISGILRVSAANIMLTRAMKSSADRLLPVRMREKNVIIPNGCDTDFFSPAPAPAHDLYRILFTGRLRGQKDPMSLLKALNMLHQEGFNFCCDILGDGPMRPKMERFIRKSGLEEKVVIRGWVDKPAMLQAYRDADVLVSVSLDEGMSIALLEATCTGLYIIATPASGNPEMISEGINGSLIPFRDPAAIAAAIKKHQLEKFKAAVTIPRDFLETYRARHSWSHTVQAYDELLKSTLP